MCNINCENLDDITEENAEKYFTEYLKAKPRIRTSDVYKTFNLPEKFECTYAFTGYGIQKERKNPFYKTVNSEYGYYPPNPHTVPTRYFPRGQKFSTELAKGGMYRNYSLNTQLDRYC